MFVEFYQAYKAEWKKALKEHKKIQKEKEKISGESWKNIGYICKRVKAASNSHKIPIVFPTTFLIACFSGIVFEIEVILNLLGLNFDIHMGMFWMYMVFMMISYKMIPSPIEITLNDKTLTNEQKKLGYYRECFERNTVKPLKTAFELFDLDPVNSLDWVIEELNELKEQQNQKPSIIRFFEKQPKEILFSIVGFFTYQIYDKVRENILIPELLEMFVIIVFLVLIIFSLIYIFAKYLRNFDKDILCMEDMRRAVVYCKHFKFFENCNNEYSEGIESSETKECNKDIKENE